MIIKVMNDSFVCKRAKIKRELTHWLTDWLFADWKREREQILNDDCCCCSLLLFSGCTVFARWSLIVRRSQLTDWQRERVKNWNSARFSCVFGGGKAKIFGTSDADVYWCCCCSELPTGKREGERVSCVSAPLGCCRHWYVCCCWSSCNGCCCCCLVADKSST